MYRFCYFDSSRVFSILKNLNLNKAKGPDRIHGLVFKNCAYSVSKPPPLPFKKTYDCGTISKEWKTALIIPVHKSYGKDSKRWNND